jgi:acyltransferase
MWNHEPSESDCQIPDERLHHLDAFLTAPCSQRRPSQGTYSCRMGEGSGVAGDSAPRRGVRSGAIDSVRVLGIVAVVAGHTLGWPGVRPMLYSWHVPLFFFLTGYFWSARRPLRQELSARTRTLVRPFIAWFLLIAVPFLLLDPTLEAGTWPRLLGPLFDGRNSAMPYTTFWFVAVLFSSIAVLRCLWLLPQPMIWCLAIAAAVMSYAFGAQLARTPLSIATAVACAILLMLGVLARRVRPHIQRPGAVGLSLLIVSALCIGTRVSAPMDVKQGDFGTPVISTVVAVSISFGLVLVAETLFEHLPSAANRIATNLSFAGFMVILTHPLILWLMLRFGPPVHPLLLFIVCLAVPWAAALAVLRTPVSPWLTGINGSEVRRLRASEALRARD